MSCLHMDPEIDFGSRFSHVLPVQNIQRDTLKSQGSVLAPHIPHAEPQQNTGVHRL